MGRVSYDWVDQSRSEILSKVPNTRREIMVDVWYPAQPNQPHLPIASYFPHAEAIDKKNTAAEAERNNWGALWKSVASSRVHAQIYDNPPGAAVAAGFPLIIFSHGFTGEPWAFTHQIAELVSHGYVVATIHHIYEVIVAAFPDGRMVPFSAENARGSEAPSLEEMLKWAEPRVNVWTADIRFTLDQLTRLNAPSQGKAQKNQNNPQVPFTIDFGHVAAMGHSFGGIAAEHACELDQRFKACLNQDGGIGGPFIHFAGGHLPTQPFMLLSSPMPVPTDEALKASHMTRQVFEKDRAEVEAGIEKDFQGCSGGAYRVTFNVPGFLHRSFTDLPLLRADTAHDRGTALHSLQLVESYTLAFFDKFLKSAPGTLLDRAPAKSGEVQIRRYLKSQTAR